MEEIMCASKHGVYSSRDLVFLRGVVREGLQTSAATPDQKQAETMARHVLNAYRRGILDRKVLLEIARMSASLHLINGDLASNGPLRSGDPRRRAMSDAPLRASYSLARTRPVERPINKREPDGI